MHRRTRFRSVLFLVFALIVALTGWLPTVAQGPVDLSVASIEVTQSIPTPTHGVSLVAQRGTAVRATVGVAGSAAPVPNVTGRLHVFVNGSEVTPAAGITPINASFSAPIAPQRANENDTLNFELPALSGISASTDVDVRVDITPVAGETNTGNNSGQVLNLTFSNRSTPSLFYTRINFTPSGLGLPADADIQPGVGDAFVRGIYPVNDADVNLYRQGLFPSLTFSTDTDGNGILDDTTTEGDALLSLLASCRQIIVDRGLGANNSTFLYGWVAGNPIDGNGLGQINGRNAYGNTEQIRHQRTYAHELGHNFGLNHNNRTIDQVGWDVGARLPGNPGGNNTTGRVKPTTLNDIMVGGQLTNSAWVDTTTYTFFFGSSVLSSGPDIDNEVDRLSEGVFVLQGIFDPSGRELVVLEPGFRFPWLSQPLLFDREQEARFIAEVTDERGEITEVRFDARVADDSGKEGEERFGFFEVMVPVPPEIGIDRVRILTADGQQEFRGFERSEPPEIRIVSPQEGEELGEKTEVAWDAADPDTPQDELMYQVTYSPDGGRSWVPIAVDVPGAETSIIFDSTEIQESQGIGVIRVFVSDGLNTAFADVSPLATAAAKYPPPNE